MGRVCGNRLSSQVGGGAGAGPACRNHLFTAGRGQPAGAGPACRNLLSPPGDDGSGSGSGDGCADDACGRRVSKKSSSSRTTLTHALPGLSEQEGQKTSAARCPQPCLCLLLLPVLALVLAASRPRWR